MTRVVLMYQHFGPYHQARLQHARASLAGAGLDVVGLQLFARPDLYQWGDLDAAPGLVDLALQTAGRDRLGLGDAATLWRTLTRLSPDVVVINGWRARDALVAHAWCLRHRVARILVIASVARRGVAHSLREAGKRLMVRGADAAFVAGTPQRRYAEALGIDPARIVDGCDVVDNAHFAAASSDRVHGGHRILTVARWAPEKNLLAAGRAFLEFAAGRPATETWRWTLIGYGPLAAELEELASRSEGRIQLAGIRNYRALPAALAQADLYWQPSLFEPWGLAVNEAMASGMPVLVSDRCGCGLDLVTSATGWRFDPSGERSLVSALRAAAERHDEWPAMGVAAASHVADWGLQRFTDHLAKSVALAQRIDAR
jgi:glycosyltransferase involved in cell wall biosynthesis